jgi:predicted flap endonuclease-1-like 5' DNA nuclease
MIERLLEVILSNRIETSILLLIGIIIGILFSYFYWMGKVRTRNNSIQELETNIKEKETEIEKLHQVQELSKKQQLEIQNLNSELEENKRERLKLSQQIQEKVADLENNLKTQIENKNQINLNLQNEINDKNKSIDLLKNQVEDLEQEYNESKSLVMNQEQKLEEFKASLEEKELEISSLNSRMSVMEDDLTKVVGIGPKVYSVLRSAGISSFSKLGSTNLDKLEDILVAENPNILRLTDPSTWSEQAKLAASQDWEALSTLQETLKSNRRK